MVRPKAKVIGQNDGFGGELEAISAFVVEAPGEPGGRARVWTAG